MALEFTICKVRWESYPQVSENTHAREWLQFQATRGLAANTLDAYDRNLDAFLRFIHSRNIPLDSVRRNTVGAYVQHVSELPFPDFGRKRKKRERRWRTQHCSSARRWFASSFCVITSETMGSHGT